jgi:hypothetical protein
MTTLREAAQQALEALEPMQNNRDDTAIQRASTALRAALAQEEQEPTVRIKCTVVDNQHPSGVPFEQWVNAPRREWQSLSEEERDAAIRWAVDQEKMHFGRAVARAIEAALKEKNNG